jgi:FkbM family methyltransferase
MTPRQWLKYQVYNRVGAFPYYGIRVYFPRRSAAFRAACEQGIFELENVRMLQALYLSGTYMFDVGANLGLMAIPLLRSIPDCKIVSFEPSPNSLPWLKRTIAGASVATRWQLVEKAVANTQGSATFAISIPEEGLYDGLQHTYRAPGAGTVEVSVTTLDAEWRQIGCPPVSVIKIDVEGGELGVIQGASECLAQTRAWILTEWNRQNLEAHNIDPINLMETAKETRYTLYAMPEVIPIKTKQELLLHMARTESFLLSPMGEVR